MTNKIIGKFLCCLLLLCCREADAAPPSQLYGKSVVLSWTDMRMQRLLGETQFHPHSAPYQYSIYISTIGRLFTRSVISSGSATGTVESMGASGSTPDGGARAANFQGHSLVIIAVFNGGARHIQIDFDANFANCTADVIVGKAAGAGSFTVTSAVTHQKIEVQSTSVAGVSCSVKDGNVFAQ